MPGASDYCENKVLDHLVGKTSFTMPTAYVALCTTAPTDSSTGATLAEATGYTGYARKSTAGADWNAASGGATTNANAITFTACSGGSATVTHFAVCDSGTTGAGNVLFYGALSASLAVSNGITPSFASGQLSVSLD